MSELTFKQIMEHCRQLKSDWGLRDEQVEDVENIFLLKDKDEEKITSKITNAMVTKSPDGRNQALGAVRLLTGANPQWDVPEKMNTEDVMEQAGDISSVADRLWRAASRVGGDPVHYDEILSLILWGESHIIVDLTSDLVRAAKGVSSAAEYRANEIANRSPVMLTNNHPKTGYPESDKHGMSAYHSSVEMTVRDFESEMGPARAKKLLAAGGLTGADKLTKIGVEKYLDFENQYLWFSKGGHGVNKGFAETKAHGFPCIPIVYTRGEGSKLFNKPEDQHQSFLYTMYKSGFWHRSNLVLTVAYTLVLALGASPMFLESLNKDGEGVTIKKMGAARKAVVESGAKFDLMDLSKLLNKDLLGLLELAERKIKESTLYPQVLGEPLGGNAPFSLQALMHQAGRLPLASTQRKGSWGCSDAMKIALRWMKNEKPEIQYPHIFGKNQDQFLEDLPDFYELTARLGLDLPEDLSENVRNAIAMRADSGSGPLMSDHWILENIMKETDPKQMKKDIFTEQAVNLKQQEYLTQRIRQEVMAEIEAEMAAAEEAEAMEAGQGGGPVNPQQPPQVGPEMEQPMPEQLPAGPVTEEELPEGTTGTEPQQPMQPRAPKR